MLPGAHVSASGGLAKVPDRAREIGAESVQIFTQSPRTWKPTRHSETDLDALRTARESGRIGYLICHAIYFINLASDDPALLAKSRDALRETCLVANRIGADGVVLHVGSHKGRGLDAVLDQVVTELREALDLLDGPWLLLENSAGAGGTIGRDPAELITIAQAVDHPRLGICLDTCHAWVSGIDVTDPEAIEALLGELDTSLGLERLRCLHVNDALFERGSNRDRHADVGAGLMGADLGRFLTHPALRDLPQILETPGGDGKGPDAAQIAALRTLHDDGKPRRRAKPARPERG
jgi:deoxyribonuclease-4